MVDVEERTLGAFGEHVLALGERAVEFNLGVGEVELAHVVHTFEPFLFLFSDVVVGEVEVAEYLLVTGFQRLVLLFETIEDVAYAKTHAGSLVAISRTDALTRGAHFVLALGSFVSAVEHAVGRKDEVSALADVKTLGELVASGFELMSLSHEEVGSNDATITYDVHLTLVEYARGNGTQHEFLTVEDNGVAGVGATGETCYHVVTGGEIVHHLALAFIAENDAEQGIYFSFSHDRIWKYLVCIVIIITARRRMRTLNKRQSYSFFPNSPLQ